jgi:tRNA dimethylallyltransferase
MERKIIAVCGPTAVGKTEYAIEIALHAGGEIVSCDSMQLYKYMNIGSAKPTPEEQAKVKHYLVDQIDPAMPFSAARYQKLAKAAIEEIFSSGKTPVICGGTGLYLNSLLYDMDFAAEPDHEGTREAIYKEYDKYGSEHIYKKLMAIDPEAASRIHPHNVKKVVRALEAAEEGDRVKDFARDLKPTKDYAAVLIGLTRDRAELYDRINQRVDKLIEAGLVDEVKGLMDMGLTEYDISMKGIGYKEVIAYLQNECSLAETVELIKKNTRHFAKRQMTWFRRYKDMKWFCISDYADDRSCQEDIFKWMEKK